MSCGKSRFNPSPDKAVWLGGLTFRLTMLERFSGVSMWVSLITQYVGGLMSTILCQLLVNRRQILLERRPTDHSQ